LGTGMKVVERLEVAGSCRGFWGKFKWPDYIGSVRFEVFMAVTMKNAVFWDVPACGSSKSRRFGGT
jgi:hypothetical protein